MKYTYEYTQEYYEKEEELLSKANELGKQGFKLQLILPNTTYNGSNIAVFIRENKIEP